MEKIKKGTILEHKNGHLYECKAVHFDVKLNKSYHFVPVGRPALSIVNAGPVVVTDETLEYFFKVKSIQA